MAVCLQIKQAFRETKSQPKLWILDHVENCLYSYKNSQQVIEFIIILLMLIKIYLSSFMLPCYEYLLVEKSLKQLQINEAYLL